MVTLHIHSEKTSNINKKERVGSRCILLKDNKVLLVHEELNDVWMIPGGGAEGNESISDCCAREMAEETGVVVSPTKLQLTINEYYDDLIYVNHYFNAEFVRETDRRLTDMEKQNDLIPKWMELDKAIGIFSKYESYEDSEPMKMGLYKREYIALSYFKASMKNGAL